MRQYKITIQPKRLNWRENPDYDENYYFDSDRKQWFVDGKPWNSTSSTPGYPARYSKAAFVPGARQGENVDSGSHMFGYQCGRNAILTPHSRATVSGESNAILTRHSKVTLSTPPPYEAMP